MWRWVTKHKLNLILNTSDLQIFFFFLRIKHLVVLWSTTHHPHFKRIVEIPCLSSLGVALRYWMVCVAETNSLLQVTYVMSHIARFTWLEVKNWSEIFSNSHSLIDIHVLKMKIPIIQFYFSNLVTHDNVFLQSVVVIHWELSVILVVTREQESADVNDMWRAGTVTNVWWVLTIYGWFFLSGV